MTKFFEVRAGAAGGSVEIPAALTGLVHVVISGAGGGGGGGAGGAQNMHNAGAGGGGGASGQLVYISFDISTIETTVLEGNRKVKILPYSLGAGGQGGSPGPAGGHGGIGSTGSESRVLLSTALGGAPGGGGAFGSRGGEPGVCLSAFAAGKGGSVKEIYVPSEPGGASQTALQLPILPGQVSAGEVSAGGRRGEYMGPGSCGGGGGGAGAPSLKWAGQPQTGGKGGTGQAGMNHDVNTFRDSPGKADYAAGGGGGGGGRSVDTIQGGAGGRGGDGFIIVWM